MCLGLAGQAGKEPGLGKLRADPGCGVPMGISEGIGINVAAHPKHSRWSRLGKLCLARNSLLDALLVGFIPWTKQSRICAVRRGKIPWRVRGCGVDPAVFLEW